jgi:hypothetical protein
MGGNRLTAAALRMDGGGKIMMDSGSSDGQRQRNGMGGGTAKLTRWVKRRQWEAMRDGWQR